MHLLTPAGTCWGGMQGDEAVSAEVAQGVLRRLQVADGGRAALYDGQAAALGRAAERDGADAPFVPRECNDLGNFQGM